MEHVRAFRLQSPDVEIQLQELALKALMEALVLGQIDIAYSPPAGALPVAIDATKIGEWPMMFGLSEDHPLAGTKPVTFAMLAKFPLVVFAAGVGDEALNQVHQHGIRKKRICVMPAARSARSQ